VKRTRNTLFCNWPQRKLHIQMLS